MSEAKETICSHCEHLWICKYRDDLLSKVKAVDEIMKNSRFSYTFICPDYIIKPRIEVRNVKENNYDF